uniref:Phosphoseryl-tRNA kinase n=1 Tax=Callorhinchus milii TaxID=7868 RepID=A0A4W3HHY7_CALMI
FVMNLDSLGFCKDYYYYLIQETNNVKQTHENVCSEKKKELVEPEAITKHSNNLAHMSLGVSYVNGKGTKGETPSRTPGRNSKQYCSFKTEGADRLVKHTLHTHTPPHRCHRCSFSTSFSRHLKKAIRLQYSQFALQCILCSALKTSSRCEKRYIKSVRQTPLMKGRRTLSSSRSLLSLLNPSTTTMKKYARSGKISLPPPFFAIHYNGYIQNFEHIQKVASIKGFVGVQTSFIMKKVKDLLSLNPGDQLAALLPPNEMENQGPV